MEKSLLAFIWRYSKRDQIVLVFVTVSLLPLIYLTLELPKRIINDAIGDPTPEIPLVGGSIGQEQLLIGLCLAFLASVLAHGLLKMRVNTMKGVLAERLLRRFRYTLIGRILRFPRSYQKRISEGELVSMVTAETEPLGGIMGDAIALPLLQAGQMLTILLFLFLQSFWFGLAAVALIPLQAWLIPRLQAQINILNRSRIKQVRALAGEIGEVASGSVTLRLNGGWRYRMALAGQRLGGLFHTRFQIYRRKFFMKFINNFLTQLTPFLFYLAGGLLAINGQLSVGALVAALAAFKDLSSPWKELLTYYTAIMEMSQRYHLIADRFSPTDLMDDFPNEKTELPAREQQGAAFKLEDVTLFDDEGHQVMNEAALDLAPGSWTCVVVEQEDDRMAFVQLVERELNPSKGEVYLDGAPLKTLSQSRIAAQIGHVTSKPYIFEGDVGDNVLMSVMAEPRDALDAGAAREAQRSGNSEDAAQTSWLPTGEVLAAIDETREELMVLVASMGAEQVLLSRLLDTPLDEASNTLIVEEMIGLRKAMQARLVEHGFAIQNFESDAYCDGLSVAENLFFGISQTSDWITGADAAAIDVLLKDNGLRAPVLIYSVSLVASIVEAFGLDAESSPLYRQLGLKPNMLPKLHALIERSGGLRLKGGDLTAEEEALCLSIAVNATLARFDLPLKEDVKTAIVAARLRVAERAPAALKDRFSPLDPTAWNPNLSMLENLFFGRAESIQRARLNEVKGIAAGLIREAVPLAELATLIRQLPTDRKGANLPPQLNEIISLYQALIKRPGLVLLDDALTSLDAEARGRAFAGLRALLPDATVLQLERTTPDAGPHDAILSLRGGRFAGDGDYLDEADSTDASTDLRRKLQAIRGAPLFSGLNSKQLRMLAFSSRWVYVTSGSYVFHQDDAPDGAYLIYEGTVRLIARRPDGEEDFEVRPAEGTLVGELGLIRNDARRLDMYAESPLVLLRIEAEDFLAILQSDAETAFKMIKVLMGYLEKPA